MSDYTYKGNENQLGADDNPGGVVRPGGSPRREDVGLPGARVSPGLSKAHISTKTSNIVIWKGASLLQVTRMKICQDNNKRGIRGAVTGFSKAARRRMMYELNKIGRGSLPVYIVVTFPDEYYPKNSDGVITRALWKAFVLRLRRRFPGCGAVYRREHETRKSGKYIGELFPHYNILIWGVDLDELREWLPNAWWQVCGRLSNAHLAAGTYCKVIENRRQMFYYVSKYVAKLDNFDKPGWGQWWGYVNRENIPWISPVSIPLDDNEAVKVIRLAKRKSGVKRNLRSITLMTENPDFWLERLIDIVS